MQSTSPNAGRLFILSFYLLYSFVISSSVALFGSRSLRLYGELIHTPRTSTEHAHNVWFVSLNSAWSVLKFSARRSCLSAVWHCRVAAELKSLLEYLFLSCICECVTPSLHWYDAMGWRCGGGAFKCLDGVTKVRTIINFYSNEMKIEWLVCCLRGGNWMAGWSHELTEPVVIELWAK